MGVRDTTVLLADTASSVQQFVSVFASVYGLCILVYVLLGWIPPGSVGGVESVRGFLRELCEPYLRPFRRIIPMIGPLDVSPIVALVTLTVAAQVVNNLIGAIL